MINITNKADCCGCQACGDVCGKRAISFQTDEEGIWYPVVDKDKCIECGLCEKVCPIINRTSCPSNAETPQCFVLQAPNSYDRLQSASGAAYTLLVRAVFEKGGFVAGHIWDDNFGVKGYISAAPDDLDILRGTKYLQSNIEGLYLSVRKLLNEGRFVLFSGTPCQNAAMRGFLHKDYNNLVMTDFVCMGIDSPLAFKKYIESLENQYESKVVYFKAKSKEVGWRFLTNKAVFDNGKTYFGINSRDANLKATFLDVLVRPSCYDCKFKGFPRVSDMTIGDYWRKKYDYDPMDDNTGTSYVMLHNEKAKELFEETKTHCVYRKIDFEELIGANRYAVSSLPQPQFSRSEFYQRLHTEDFARLVDDYSEMVENKKPRSLKLRKIAKLILSALYFYRNKPADLLCFIHYNFFSKKVETRFFKGDILVLRNFKLNLSRGAKITVKGICLLESKHIKSFVNMGRNARLSLDNNKIGEGTSISLENDAEITLGFKSIVGNRVDMLSQTVINIGDFSTVADNVRIDDTNQGILYFDEINDRKRLITLGTHVLLNRGCYIKACTSIQDECIVAENAVVSGVFKSGSYIEGNPGTITNKKINWKNNFDNVWNFRN